MGTIKSIFEFTDVPGKLHRVLFQASNNLFAHTGYENAIRIEALKEKSGFKVYPLLIEDKACTCQQFMSKLRGAVKLAISGAEVRI